MEARPVGDFDPVAAGIAAKHVRLIDRTALFAMAAADQALVDAGLPDEALDAVGRERVATVVGSGIGGRILPHISADEHDLEW